jgi:hypothetical protein
MNLKKEVEDLSKKTTTNINQIEVSIREKIDQN